MTTRQEKILGCLLGAIYGQAQVGRDGGWGTQEFPISELVRSYAATSEINLATTAVAQARQAEEIFRKGGVLEGFVDPSAHIYLQLLEGKHPYAVQALMGRSADPQNDRKDAVVLARAIPIGLVYSKRRAWMYGCEAAALTNGGVEGWLPAGFLARLLSSILYLSNHHPYQALIDSYQATMLHLERRPVSDPLSQQSTETVRQLMVQAYVAEKVPQLGTGSSGAEALAIAFHSVYTNPTSVQKAVRTALSLSGSSEVVGCLAGALAGALHGEKAIPEEGLEDLDRLWAKIQAEQICEVSWYTGEGARV